MNTTTQVMKSDAAMRNRLAMILNELAERSDQAMNDLVANSDKGASNHWSEGRYDGLREAIDLVSAIL
jgi:hypothetical protein